MTSPRPTNMAASVHQRLINLSSKVPQDFQVIMAQYAYERLLYRLSKSRYAAQFMVKGALMFWVWAGEQFRPTKDLDLLSLRRYTAKQLKEIFKTVCNAAVEDDGLLFPEQAIRAEPIRDDNEYGGMRVMLIARLGQARLSLQVDVGFGDAVTPLARQETFPALLDFPAPLFAMYPREATVAEKFDAMVNLGMNNSRMKDYYDIWVLAHEFEFDGASLKDAIQATFGRRKRDLPTGVPVGLADEFAADATKQTQWIAFARRTKLKRAGHGLGTIVPFIRDFLMPPTLAAVESKPFKRKWPKGGHWQA